MNSLILLCAVLQAAPAVERPWELGLGAGGVVAPETAGFGGVATVSASRSVLPWLRPLVSFGLGARRPGELLNLIRVGLRFELPWERRWQPFLAVAFAHNHETGFEHVAMAPLSAVFGLSDHGTNHRTGVETGLGIRFELPSRPGPGPNAIAGLQASVSALAGTGPTWNLGLGAWVGVAF